MKDPNYTTIFTLLLPILLITTLSRQATSAFFPVDRFLHCLSPISESIYTPNNSSFNSVLQARIRNRRFLTIETPKPVAIVVASHVSHVQATVVCAKQHGLQIRIRSGGHDYEGLSYRSNVTFVILDMFKLGSIDIDIKNEIAWVQAGATLGELYYNIAKKSKVHAFPAGVCPGLGVGGHFSGGGYGNMMRKYGLSVDNIIDAQVVDANGNIHDRASMGEDLFWAIRGGGGASFTVIVSWKIKLVRVPERVTVFKLPFTLEQGATDVVFKWQQVAPKQPDDLFIRAIPSVINGTRPAGAGALTVVVKFVGFFLGQTDKLVPLLHRSFPELNLTKSDCHEMSWVESALFWANFPTGTPVEVLLNKTEGAQDFFKSKSDYVKTVIPKEGLERIWKMMIGTGKMVMQWNPYGGKMNEIPDSETPFPHRAGNLYKIQYLRSWLEEGNNVSSYNIDILRGVYDGMAPYVSKDPREAFLNYRDLEIGSIASGGTDFGEAQIYGGKYFKHNFQRLTMAKAKVDPSDFFKNEQSIPPTTSSSD